MNIKESNAINNTALNWIAMDPPFEIIEGCALPPNQLEAEYASSFIILTLMLAAAIQKSIKN